MIVYSKINTFYNNNLENILLLCNNFKIILVLLKLCHINQKI